MDLPSEILIGELHEDGKNSIEMFYQIQARGKIA